MKMINAKYEADYYEWTQDQASLLRANSLEFIDRENLAEEIESLGRSERREVFSRLRVILTHLIQWECQPCDRSRSWAGTIRTQRLDLERLFSDSPSLRNYALAVIDQTYEEALDRSTDAMGYLTPLRESFKKTYTLEQVMREDIAL